MKKLIWLVAGLSLVLGACAEMDTKSGGGSSAAASSDPAFNAVVASAEKEIAAAKKVGIWKDTEKFLSEAKEAKAAGKDEEAMKKAKKALKQAQMAQKQAASQANAKPHFPK